MNPNQAYGRRALHSHCGNDARGEALVTELRIRNGMKVLDLGVR
jgi:hypothetical protein